MVFNFASMNNDEFLRGVGQITYDRIQRYHVQINDFISFVDWERLLRKYDDFMRSVII